MSNFANRSFLASSDDLLRCAETVARCMHEGRIGDIKSMQESHKKVGRRVEECIAIFAL